jgi:hypothetical protein
MRKMDGIYVLKNANQNIKDIIKIYFSKSLFSENWNKLKKKNFLWL